jgi:uncharacterized protein (DUF488 family)
MRRAVLLLLLCLTWRQASAQQPRCVYTIGHSRHEIASFVSLLRQHGIGVLADVRSQPVSRRAPQFNQRALQQALASHGIRYCYLGDQLGGLPEDRTFYDDPARRRKVSYERIEASPQFQQGLAELGGLLAGQRVVLLCAEEDPRQCHRNRLISPNLVERGLQVWHIRGDGRLEPFDWASLGRRAATRRPGSH